MRALRGLPFDHDIIEIAAQRVRSKSGHSSLPAHLCSPEFTLPELHAVYQAVMGRESNLARGRRQLADIMAAAGIEEVPGRKRQEGRSRPAQL